MEEFKMLTMKLYRTKIVDLPVFDELPEYQGTDLVKDIETFVSPDIGVSGSLEPLGVLNSGQLGTERAPALLPFPKDSVLESGTLVPAAGKQLTEGIVNYDLGNVNPSHAMSKVSIFSKEGWTPEKIEDVKAAVGAGVAVSLAAGGVYFLSKLLARLRAKEQADSRGRTHARSWSSSEGIKGGDS
jgi:hypothetical protein